MEKSINPSLSLAAQFTPQISTSIITGMESFITQVEGLEEEFIERLRKAVNIPSVSADPKLRSKVVAMAEFLTSELKTLGFSVEHRALGKQAAVDIDLPPVVLARLGNDKKKKTVLVYGHYDVQPAAKADGWSTEPFDLAVKPSGQMFGRGATDDKGPLLGWLNVVEAHKKAGVQMPVNLCCCFEGMEESGSEGLEKLIIAEANAYFAGVDCVCIADNYWLGTKKPCVTYGLRGCSYYEIEVSGPSADLHSGMFGGSVGEPMTDLVQLMASLVSSDGKILIPGIMDQVEKLTDKEKALYPEISYSMDDLHSAIGAKTGLFDDPVSTLMSRWRYPSLSLHGIQGAFSGGGAKTVIPAKVKGKFSIRTVPYMDMDKVDEIVYAHLNASWKTLGSKNTMKPGLVHRGPWWKSNYDHTNYKAAADATQRVYGMTPDYTREGGSIPVTITFEEALQRNVLLLPMGRGDDGAHSTNEKLDKSNYINGIKLQGAYLHQLAIA